MTCWITSTWASMSSHVDRIARVGSSCPDNEGLMAKQQVASGTEAPLYRRVVDVLRADIANSRHAVGDRLPTEDALCRRFGVSRHTVREALRALRDEGLVASRQGAGTTVVRRTARPLYVTSVSSIEEL